METNASTLPNVEDHILWCIQNKNILIIVKKTKKHLGN